jgi:protein required for attachment to host cells
VARAEEDLIARWKAWDEHPDNKEAANALVEGADTFTQGHATELYRHVAASRRAGLSIAAAIYTWRPPWT